MTITFVNKKKSAGNYTVSTKERPDLIVDIVQVEYPNDGIYWIADPKFDNNCGDPQWTKRDAVKSARELLKQVILK